MPAAVFDLIQECTHLCIKKEVTNFRKTVGLKLAITLRHLATGETYMPLQYHWLVGQTTICKFVPKVCLAILVEFQEEYLNCLTTPEYWKQIKERLRTRLHVPHTLRALDRKHITMKKPKKSGSAYYVYKSFFTLVLLALVDTEYRFLWVYVGQVDLHQLHKYLSAAS